MSEHTWWERDETRHKEVVGKLQNGMSKNKGKQRKKQKGSVFRLLLLSAYFRILQCVCEILTKTTEWTKYSTPMLLVGTLFFTVMECCSNHALAFSTTFHLVTYLLILILYLKVYPHRFHATYYTWLQR